MFKHRKLLIFKSKCAIYFGGKTQIIKQRICVNAVNPMDILEFSGVLSKTGVPSLTLPNIAFFTEYSVPFKY